MKRALYCGERSADRELARAFLRDGGVLAGQLDWAPTLGEARRAFRRTDYELVLVDQDLAGGQGIAVVELGKRLGVTAPIFLLTSDGHADGLIDAAIEVGCADVLVRSALGPAELRRAVAKARSRGGAPGSIPPLPPERGVAPSNLFKERVERGILRARRTRLGVAVLSIGLSHPASVRGVTIDPAAFAAATRIREQVRATDSIAQAGASRYLVLLEDLENGPSAGQVADRILEALERPIELEGVRVGPRVDVGIALHPDDAASAASLIQSAEGAFERAREGSAGRFWFQSRPIHRGAVRKARLRRALRRDLASMEFELHYQPRMDLRSGQAVGVEALLRYFPPGIGEVSPTELVPLLEEMGRIDRVGEWALFEACRAGRSLLDHGYPVVMGVNVSALQIDRGLLEESVERALDETGLPPELLELELTEGILIENTEATCALLSRLRARGVRVAVDDFGTGYASLRYVKHFPMDAIKIDLEFVRGLPHDPENAAISGAIIALGHSLGLEVIAEGVEREEEEAFLSERGCDFAQGYLWAHPMAAADLLSFLTDLPSFESGLAPPMDDLASDAG